MKETESTDGAKEQPDDSVSGVDQPELNPTDQTNLITTPDGEHYRRWMNLIPAVLVPGSAQYLAGRKKAGIIWLGVYLLLPTLLVIYLVHPRTRVSADSVRLLRWIALLFWLVMVIDGFRHPIRRFGGKKWALLFGVCLCVQVIPLLGIRQSLLQAVTMRSASMQPTIKGLKKASDGQLIEGDHILINKLIYHLGVPQRGDIVAFRVPRMGAPAAQEDIRFVSRVVGLPWETVSLDPPYLVVDGTRITRPDIFRRIAEGENGFGGYRLGQDAGAYTGLLKTPADKIVLGQDEYLVMGDNSRNSLDGRYFGPIKRSAIFGKVFYIYAPAEREGRIE